MGFEYIDQWWCVRAGTIARMLMGSCLIHGVLWAGMHGWLLLYYAPPPLCSFLLPFCVLTVTNALWNKDSCIEVDLYTSLVSAICSLCI